MVAKGDDLPIPSRVVRYVPSGRMRKHEDDDNIIFGPNPNAFEQRATDNYLSVTWCQYFEGSKDQQLRCSIEAIRNSKLEVKPKACFCIAETDSLFAAIQDAGKHGRAVYHPEDDNLAHAGIYGIAPDELQLLARLADEVWSDYLTKGAADALPTSDCAKSANVE